MSKERSELLLGAEILALIKVKHRNLREITDKIYGNDSYKNMTRVYTVLEAFMKHGLVVPIFKNRVLFFKVVDE